MREVMVVVSDPWSFVDVTGSNVFTARVRATDGDLVLLELAGGLYVASPREVAGFSLIPITEEQSKQEAPWGRDDWRGQPTALLGDIQGL